MMKLFLAAALTCAGITLAMAIELPPEIAKQVIAKHFPEENLAFMLIGKASEIGPGVKKYAAQQDSRKISEPGFWPGAK